MSVSHQKLICTRPGQGLSFEPNMKQIHEAVKALEGDIILAAILDFVEETQKTTRKIIRQIFQGEYAYCKYLEIMRAGVYSYITKIGFVAAILDFV